MLKSAEQQQKQQKSEQNSYNEMNFINKRSENTQTNENGEDSKQNRKRDAEQLVSDLKVSARETGDPTIILLNQDEANTFKATPHTGDEHEINFRIGKIGGDILSNIAAFGCSHDSNVIRGYS